MHLSCGASRPQDVVSSTLPSQRTELMLSSVYHSQPTSRPPVRGPNPLVCKLTSAVFAHLLDHGAPLENLVIGKDEVYTKHETRGPSSRRSRSVYNLAVSGPTSGFPVDLNDVCFRHTSLARQNTMQVQQFG